VSSTLRGDLAVLSEQSFLFLFLARTVSLFGSAVALGALPFAVLGMHGGSATVLGQVLGARSLAQVALLLFGGVLADRRRPLGTMLAGPLSEAIGASGSLYGAGALMTLATIATFASRSVRQLPAEVTASAVPARASLMKPPPPAA